jgi:hypothetical protein
VTSLTDRCPTCGIDPPTVSPSDAAVAIRSFPRRFKEAIDALEDDPERAAQATAEAARAAAVIRAAAGALRLIEETDNPTVSLAVDTAVAGADPVAALRDAADVIVPLIEATSGEGWRRTGTDPQFGTVTALDVVRHAVHAGAHALRAVSG